MPSIVTITLNPALDVFTVVERVVPMDKLRCSAPELHPGGGGINVARVAHRLGVDVLALFASGGATGQRLRQMLDAEQVPAAALPIAGETRESFSVHEQASGNDYRFVLPGPALATDEWQACLDRLAALPSAPQFLVASGSLPPGVPEDFYARLARWGKARGCKVVVDAAGPALEAALAEGVYLIKPSRRELAGLTGVELDTPHAQLAACRRIIGAKQAEVVALSLGEQGALVASAQGIWRAPALHVQVKSTIGAGDSFLAGLLTGQLRGGTMAEALRHAMAAAGAALLSSGTALCTRAEVESLLPGVKIDSL